MPELGSKSKGWMRLINPLPWLRDHRRVAADALNHFSRRLGASLLAWLLIGIALALPAGLFLVQAGLSGLTERWQGRPGLSVYFQLGEEGDALAEALRQQPKVHGVSLVSAEQALAEFRAQTQLADALDALESNPLPASLEATLAPDAGPEDLQRLVEFAQGGAGVEQVVVEKTWLQRMIDLSRVIRRLGAILGVLFGIGAALVTAISVRLAIETQLEELKVMKLVGASDGQLRRPFLYFGLLYGLGGGMVAAMLLSLGIAILEGPLASLLGSFGQEFGMQSFGPEFLLALLAASGALGLAGALLALRQRKASLDIE